MGWMQMAQVTVAVNGRDYDLTCGDGEEAHLLELASYIDGKITALRGAGVNLSDAQLLLMAGLVIADELSDAKEPVREGDAVMNSFTETMTQTLDAMASRLEKMAAQIEAS
jgi:cell division protein ZapA